MVQEYQFYGKSISVALMVLLAGVEHTMADQIHDAAKAGDIAGLTSLVDAGADLDETSPVGTALAVAVRAQQGPAVEFLISQGADPDIAGILGTPLQIATMKGAADLVRMLLEAGADPNLGEKRTPLFIAANRGQLEIARLLLSGGADPDATAGSEKETALHEAARVGNQDLVRILIEGGADPNALTLRMQHAYHLALLNERDTVADYLGPLTAPDFDPVPVTDLIGNVDMQAAEEFVRDKCGFCHQLGDLTGESTFYPSPRLWSLEGLPKGVSDPDFSYSTGMYESEEPWSVDELNKFIAAAPIVVPGTKMDHAPTYAPVSDPVTRAGVIAFLRTLGPPRDR